MKLTENEKLLIEIYREKIAEEKEIQRKIKGTKNPNAERFLLLLEEIEVVLEKPRKKKRNKERELGINLIVWNLE